MVRASVVLNLLFTETVVRLTVRLYTTDILSVVFSKFAIKQTFNDTNYIPCMCVNVIRNKCKNCITYDMEVGNFDFS